MFQTKKAMETEMQDIFWRRVKAVNPLCVRVASSAAKVRNKYGSNERPRDHEQHAALGPLKPGQYKLKQTVRQTGKQQIDQP